MADFWWQLHCKLHLDRSPEFRFPVSMTEDRFYRVLQATSMLQQLPLAVLLFSPGRLDCAACMERLGLAWNLHTPETLPPRANLVSLNATSF